MAIVPISTWATLGASAGPWQGLLVGNGGSIALHQGFSYGSLFSAAAAANRLPTTQPLFAALLGGGPRTSSTSCSRSRTPPKWDSP